MKIIIDLMVLYKGNEDNFVFGAVRREVETNLVPVTGMEIEDSAWKNPREIKRVTMNPDEGYYHLWVGDDETNERQRAYNQVQMYKSHGWQVLSCSDA
ncbi:hypothetical protein ACN2MB_004610 [Vibrio parahaemolyticus]|uniref:hypothetical protein n=1 Tax=Vibrio parahaemolyticus TaxID=670 RepID=UPI0011238086|nr:hypothetical protein [Vibrio parahaemolyticus]TOI86887.1 hypothetical protein CGI50_23990 [Vibrio parahaemolyticus]